MVAFGEYEDDGTASAMKARDYKDATDLVAHSLTASRSSTQCPNEDTTLVAHALRGEGFDASEDGTGRGTPIVPVAIQDTRGMDKAQNGKGWSDDGTSYTVDALATQGVVQPVAFAQNTRDEVRLFNGDGSIAGALAAEPGMKQTTYVAFTAKDHGGDAVEGISPTLRAGGHTGSHANAGVMPAIAFAHQAGGKQTTLGAIDDGTCQTLGAHQTPAIAFKPGSSADARSIGAQEEVGCTLEGGGGGNNRQAIAAAWGVRRLTPTECERLQGFPDGWTAIPWGKKTAEECPDGPRYKALGNSMAVNVMCFIGERIEAVRAAAGEG